MDLRNALGFGWSTMPSPGRTSSAEEVLLQFRSGAPQMVWDAATLAGSPLTFTEVKTLSDGVTVGSRRVSDVQQVLRVARAVQTLDSMLGSCRFKLAREASDEIHASVSPGTTGRSPGAANLDTDYVAERVGSTDDHLHATYSAGLASIAEIPDPYHQGLAYFAFAFLHRFYPAENCQTALLMSSGHLMMHGYPAISVPGSRRREWNATLAGFYAQRDATKIFDLLGTCSSW